MTNLFEQEDIARKIYVGLAKQTKPYLWKKGQEEIRTRIPGEEVVITEYVCTFDKDTEIVVREESVTYTGTDTVYEFHVQRPHEHGKLIGQEAREIFESIDATVDRYERELQH